MSRLHHKTTTDQTAHDCYSIKQRIIFIGCTISLTALCSSFCWKFSPDSWKWILYFSLGRCGRTLRTFSTRTARQRNCNRRRRRWPLAVPRCPPRHMAMDTVSCSHRGLAPWMDVSIWNSCWTTRCVRSPLRPLSSSPRQSSRASRLRSLITIFSIDGIPRRRTINYADRSIRCSRMLCTLNRYRLEERNVNTMEFIFELCLGCFRYCVWSSIDWLIVGSLRKIRGIHQPIKRMVTHKISIDPLVFFVLQ